MCGICGYVGTHAPELLEPMCQAMAHRGPDDAGTWHDAQAGVGLGHRRLSIIDVSPAGHQPMCNEDGTVWISYNGEIYNFPELREDLLARGHTFRGRSDTEVLVHLYEERGPQMLELLNGIFAFALWDGRRRQLLLARDHAGIKPLYYRQDGGRLYFASEVKALLRIPHIPREVNREVLCDYLTFLYVPGSQTMFRGIRKVQPGHYVTWRDGHLETRRWFSVEYQPDESLSEDEWCQRVRETLLRVTRRQMVSDVPLGAFLSGGLDSSSVAACMRQAFPERRIKCYTTYFEPSDMVRDQFEDDYPYARQVARHLDIDLHSFVLKPDCVSLLPRMIYHLDEPDADPAVFPAYMIARFAREDGTIVLLSGTGGDEVFFGYRSHRAYRHYERLETIPRWITAPALALAHALAARLLGAQASIPRRIGKFRRGLLAHGLDRHMSLVDWSSPATRRRLFSPALRSALRPDHEPPAAIRDYAAAFRGRGALNLHSHLLIHTFLSDHNFLYTDKSSMATSIEVRVPFMDVELIRLCAAIPERYRLRGRVTKHLLKRAMAPYLPRSVLYRSKTGFGAPLRKWIVEDLDPLVRETLSPERLKQRGLFDPQAVSEILQENRANRADHAYLIYCLLTLELWQQTFIDRPAEVVTI